MAASNKNRFRLRTWGDFACFTRPKMKAERVSYEVMTPSAARNILQSILWKPAIEWKIEKIEILKPIRWTSIRRNELGSVIPSSKVKQAMKSDSHELGVFIEDDRQQRAGLFLRDVDYIIHASFFLTNKAGQSDNETKFREQFVRRASKGQCFWQPYFGCREFAAYFSLLDADSQAPESIEDTRNIGWMLYDMDYSDRSPVPMFFNASITNGAVLIPDWNSNEVKR